MDSGLTLEFVTASSDENDYETNQFGENEDSAIKEPMYVGWIYKITNLNDGKCYIGQTIQADPQVRWARHVNDAVYYHKDAGEFHVFLKAIDINLENKKFSNELFSENWRIGEWEFEVVQKVEETTSDFKISLDEAEVSWVEKENSYSDGYNSNLGGHGCYTLVSDQEILDLWNRGWTRTDIAAYLQKNPDYVSNVLKNHSIDPLREMGLRQKRQDLDDEEICRLYDEGLTGKEISEKFNCNTSTIRRRLLKLGYDTEFNDTLSRANPVRLTNIWTNYSVVFQSISDAGRWLAKFTSVTEINCLSAVSAIIHGTNSRVYGFTAEKISREACEAAGDKEYLIRQKPVSEVQLRYDVYHFYTQEYLFSCSDKNEIASRIFRSQYCAVGTAYKSVTSSISHNISGSRDSCYDLKILENNQKFDYSRYQQKCPDLTKVYRLCSAENHELLATYNYQREILDDIRRNGDFSEKSDSQISANINSSLGQKSRLYKTFLMESTVDYNKNHALTLKLAAGYAEI